MQCRYKCSKMSVFSMINSSTLSDDQVRYTKKRKNVKNRLRLFVSEWSIQEMRGISVHVTYILSTYCVPGIVPERGDKDASGEIKRVLLKVTSQGNLIINSYPGRSWCLVLPWACNFSSERGSSQPCALFLATRSTHLRHARSKIPLKPGPPSRERKMVTNW